MRIIVSGDIRASAGASGLWKRNNKLHSALDGNHNTSEAPPQTDEHGVKCGVDGLAPVACIDFGMVNHSVEWDRRKANRLAVKAPRNRSRDERTTDCR